MSRRRSSHRQSANRARVAAGPEAAAPWERGLMGALLLRPRLIRAFAVAHPPAWFTNTGALEIMRALFCASAGARKPTLDILIDTLESHDTLDLAGGVDAVRALMTPRPELDRALRELDDLLGRLAPAEREQIAQAEDLDEFDSLVERGLNPTARTSVSDDLIESVGEPAARPAIADDPWRVGHVEADEQLTLFRDRPSAEEIDRA